MVLVKAKRDELLDPLSAVSGIIERRHTLPILSNVLIERVGGNASFLATDIEIQIIAKQRHSTAAGEAQPSPSARASFSTSCARCRTAAEVDAAAAGQAAAGQGRARADSRCRPCRPRTSRGWPSRPAMRHASSSSRRRCARLLSLVQYAMAQQDIRYYLNGLLMVVEEAA